MLLFRKKKPRTEPPRPPEPPDADPAAADWPDATLPPTPRRRPRRRVGPARGRAARLRLVPRTRS